MNLNTKVLAITAVFVGSVAMANAIVITQSASQSIIGGNSVSCNSGGVHTENSYSRGFTLAAHGITQPFNVTSVSYGVEVANAGGTATSQLVTVRIYDGWTLSGGNLVYGALVGTTVQSVADGAAFIQSTTITGTINSGFLALEVMTPDATATGGTGDSFFIGSNNLGQTGPSYLRAPACGVTANTPTGSIGFAGMHVVMNVEGTVVPEPASMAALSLGALALIRRRRSK